MSQLPGGVFEEFAQRRTDPDGEPVSIFFAVHPDVARSA